MMFELATGDFLFEPQSGTKFSKDDDHLAQIVELLGVFPRHFSITGKKSKHYFTSKGSLRRIKRFHYWPLKSVLMEKYKYKEAEALAYNDFLMPMLDYDVYKRATAQ